MSRPQLLLLLHGDAAAPDDGDGDGGGGGGAGAAAAAARGGACVGTPACTPPSAAPCTACCST
jgi:hypothetical protein